MELIDRDKLLEVMEKRKRPENGADGSKERYRYMQWLADYWAIKDAPTIDAVEVVRCKDCNGCKFVGSYDTQFPCANCARKTKDYYEPQTEGSE